MRTTRAESFTTPLRPRAGESDAAPDPSGREVFEILAREHADMLAGFLYCLVRSRAAVDDLFQETMLTAWRRLADYDRARPFGPWLRGIALRLAQKHRARAARALPSFAPEELAALEAGMAAEVDADGGLDGALERLRRCWARLPEAAREVLAMVYERGLALEAVAREVRSSEEAVKKRAQRGRAQLAECMRLLEASS